VSSDVTALVSRFAPGAVLLRTSPLGGGISGRMLLLEFARAPSATPERAVLRQMAWGTPEQRLERLDCEHRTLQLARELDLLAPKPLGFDRQDEPSLFIEHIDALPDFAPQSIAAMTAEMARALARIHRVRAQGPRFEHLPRIAVTRAEWLAQTPEQLDESLGERRIRDALQAAGAAPRCEVEVLLHGDYWPGNLLWRGSQLAAIVDWEEAAVGDPLYDIAIARLDLWLAFGEEAMRGFTEQYLAEAPADERAMAWWDLRVALRPCGNLARWAAAYGKAPINRPDITEHTMREAHQAFVEAALEQL
jgi:aminoglycoside phosphotransferase (APT) family kinase protein